MAVNKDPFVRSRSKDGIASTAYIKVQAGSTQAIKIGEICNFNETAGYAVPVDAAGDEIYPLCISAEEQKSDDSERFMKFYTLDPNDTFEFILAAARALAIGDGFTLTTSDSQKLTYSTTGQLICHQVDTDHYPETGTTIRNRSYARVIFDPAFTYWGLHQTRVGWGKTKYTTQTSALTLYVSQSGLIIDNTGASAATRHTLPQSAPKGTKYTAICTVAQENGFAPGAAGAIYVEGAKQSDNKYVTVSDEGDSLTVIADGNGDWFALANISSTAEIKAVITIQS